MNLYLASFRINLPHVIISNLIGFYSYNDSKDLLFSLVIMIATLPIIFVLLSPFINRYGYFFHNKGWNNWKIYSVAASIDFGIFLSVIALFL